MTARTIKLSLTVATICLITGCRSPVTVNISIGTGRAQGGAMVVGGGALDGNTVENTAKVADTVNGIGTP
jgi:hypothetical protein